ncbi:JAB domain-containing protein, partial [Streptococcus suis]
EPSSNDIALTKKIRVAAELLDMYLLDHIILTAEGYYSFANEGLL